jgi:hypothetical protein
LRDFAAANSQMAAAKGAKFPPLISDFAESKNIEIFDNDFTQKY